MRHGSWFRVLLALVCAFALTLGSVSAASAGGVVPPDSGNPEFVFEVCEDNVIARKLATEVEADFFGFFNIRADIDEIFEICAAVGFQPTFVVIDGVLVLAAGGGGDVDTVGNDNGNDQGNTQGQGQSQNQGQTASQGTANSSGQGSTSSGASGASVVNGCTVSQGDDDAGDDAAGCTSGDASAGDSAVGDSSQANSGSQTGSNAGSQTGDQTGGNQSNTPGNSTDQVVDADVTDIGGDDNDTDDDSINGNTGTIDQSDDSGVIEGDDNELGGAALLSQFLAILLVLLSDITDGGGGEPNAFFTCNAIPGLPEGIAVQFLVSEGLLADDADIDDVIALCDTVGVDLGIEAGDVVRL